ncbi:hypothetical protein TNCV_1659651 [Trichonephila clavipes]|nr:hypothetical protein TNCV_1659651 [Trichonephila clavipes]
MFEIKFIALKVAESFLEALDECIARSKKRLYSYAILGISATVIGDFSTNYWVESSHQTIERPLGKVLRDIYGPEIDAIDLQDLMSDTESDSDAKSDSFSESMLEFIPGTMDQLIQDLLESIPRC